jgi:2',3'-cyclic-nucleotide 2'-phosphodiesterase (5'-nucleotidase family)
MKLLTFQILLALTTAYGCPDGHAEHVHSPRGQLLPATISPPTRALEWGDINIIHTTDSHGWLLGHQKSSFPEPNYRCGCLVFELLKVAYNRPSGDFGDFASFVSHMKDIAKVKALLSSYFAKN